MKDKIIKIHEKRTNDHYFFVVCKHGSSFQQYCNKDFFESVQCTEIVLFSSEYKGRNESIFIERNDIKIMYGTNDYKRYLDMCKTYEISEPLKEIK